MDWLPPTKNALLVGGVPEPGKAGISPLRELRRRRRQDVGRLINDTPYHLYSAVDTAFENADGISLQRFALPGGAAYPGGGPVFRKDSAGSPGCMKPLWWKARQKHQRDFTLLTV